MIEMSLPVTLWIRQIQEPRTWKPHNPINPIFVPRFSAPEWR